MAQLILKTSFAALLLTGLSACAPADSIPATATTASDADNISLELDHQEQKTYNCDGSLASDGMAVVSSPTQRMKIAPSRGTSGPDYQLVGSSFYDVQTGSTGGVDPSYTKFTIDHGDGYLNMHVITGINEIRYSFTFSDGTVENGSRFINVAYSERTLAGVLEVHPTPDQCSPQQQ